MLDFVGIGAQKAGTTWLHKHLSEHPEVNFPAGKEVHYWNRYRNKVDIPTYASWFPDQEGIKQGEITPAYAFLPVENIQEIHQYFPNIRIIYMLRDPIERAWSSSLMALSRAEMTINEASDQWFIDHFKSAGSRARGDYKTCLANWTSIYPKEQILLLDFADIKTDPINTLKKAAHHIGVSATYFDTLNPDIFTKKVHATSGDPIRASILPVLEELYKEGVVYYQEVTKGNHD